MPVEPILDLSRIDLSACAADRAGIALYNPHRPPFALIDSIIWHDAALDNGVAVWNVRHDEFWVPGHIPGEPLVPGVLMIEAGAQLSSYMYYKRSGKGWFAGFTRIEDVTFRGRVVPGDTFYLLCVCQKYSPKRFISKIQGIVNNSIAFEGTITGMGFPKLGEVERTGTSA